MKDRFEPFIEAHYYDAFRRLLDPQLPDTYNEWLNLSLEKGKDSAFSDYKVRNIKVEPNEFVRYCRARKYEHTLDSLRKFAASIAGGRNRY